MFLLRLCGGVDFRGVSYAQGRARYAITCVRRRARAVSYRRLGPFPSTCCARVVTCGGAHNGLLGALLINDPFVLLFSVLAS